MPYPNGGNRYARGRWYPAPNIPALTLEERRQMLVRAGFDVPEPTPQELAQIDIARRAQQAASAAK